MTTGMKKSQHGNKVHIAFDPSPYVGDGVTRSEVLELKDAFDLLDVSGTGKLDATCTSLLS